MASIGGVLKLDTQRIAGYRNFGTKLWNAARFAEINDCKPDENFTPHSVNHTLNKWIVGETARFKEKMDKIIYFINQFKLIDKMVTPILIEKDMVWIKNTKRKYLLTASQVDQLINYAKGYRLRNHDNALPELDIQIPKTKNNQKDTFKLICEKLKT